jgi:D-alanyl-lipoteichoic acid acyltransferase DltB (MBOAT superfamily)
VLFNTWNFAAFFAVVFTAYWRLPRRGQNALLLGAGYYFYGCWDARFLILLISSTLVDFGLGLLVDRLENPASRRIAVAASLALNLGYLGFFKYFNFFAGSLGSLLASMGLNTPNWTLEIALPIGISFYTFQSMSYVIDVYRRHVKPTRDLVEFATFVSFFPHLVAGPIMRPTTLLPQIEKPRTWSFDQFYEGMYLIFWGLAKKTVIADNLGAKVVQCYGDNASITGGEAWVLMLAFAFQVYGDFSGYTDMARGVAKCLGFELALNFNLPYFSANPAEFWSRWHISLSQWFRDYVFIPLGGSRHGLGKTCLNLMITMTLCGLWHGAAWNYVLFGVYAGGLLVAHRLLRPVLDRIQPRSLLSRSAWSLTRILAFFHLHGLGLLLFRSRSLAEFGRILTGIATRPAWPSQNLFAPVLVLVLPLVVIETIQYLARDTNFVLRLPWPARSAFYTATLYAIVFLGNFGAQQFIYFQF